MKRLVILAAAALFAAGPAAAQSVVRVGVTAGPHAEIMELVKKIAAPDGIDIRIVEFQDYVQPNAALAQGDLDANSFQHQPYLDVQVRDRKYEIVSIAKTLVFPLGIYSKKIKSLADLKSGTRVAIPNDPTNGGRALLLLQANGILSLKPGAGLTATPLDVATNTRNVRIIELDAAQLPRSLEDVEAAAVNTNFAIQAGLLPARDAIALEDANSPYANIIAVRTRDKDKPELAKLVKAYHSAEVKKFVEEKYQRSVVPAF